MVGLRSNRGSSLLESILVYAKGRSVLPQAHSGLEIAPWDIQEGGIIQVPQSNTIVIKVAA